MLFLRTYVLNVVGRLSIISNRFIICAFMRTVCIIMLLFAFNGIVTSVRVFLAVVLNVIY